MSSAAVIWGCLHAGSFQVKTKPGITDCLAVVEPNVPILSFLLVKIREFFFKALMPAGLNEHQHVIIKSLICSKSLLTVRYMTASVCWILFLSSRFFTSSLCTSDIGTKYFSVLCLTMEGINRQFFRVSEENLTLTILHILLDIQSNGLRHAEILHCFGIVTRNSVHKWKKWSIAWREVKITAVWSKTEIFCCLNSFAERLSTLINGRKSIFTPYFSAMS